MKKKSIVVSQSTIRNLYPCQSRLDNYIGHYGNKKFTIKQFLALKKITVKDKLWVAFHSMPKASLKACAIEIAKSVLHIYEARYPNDMRPRRALENPTLANRHAAAYAAYADAAAADAAAYAAADAAADAAAYAAYAAADAAAYAAYAAAADADAAAADAYAAYAAADAAAYAAYAAAADADAAAADAYAAADAAAYAAYAAAAAADAAKKTGRSVQEKINLKIVAKHWK
jgi:hypothetical protein